MKTYRLTAAGRRSAAILLIGAIIIWAFALWTFRSTLGISYNPLEFWGTLRASVEQGLGVGQVVPALLMLVLIIATPLVVWNILEEYDASYTPAEDGLRFSSLGVRVTYPWSAITGMHSVDEDSDEPMDELALDQDYSGQIGNPALRFLHRQAYGPKRLPLYAALQDRGELIEEIRRRAALVSAPAAAPAAEGAAS